MHSALSKIPVLYLFLQLCKSEKLIRTLVRKHNKATRSRNLLL